MGQEVVGGGAMSERCEVDGFPCTEAQRDFLLCEAPAKALSGPPGCGKTFAGAWDLIRRAEAGKSYLAVATSHVGSDELLRAFVASGDRLRAVGTIEMEQGRVILQKGARVLLAPPLSSLLAGIELAGIWLDECEGIGSESIRVLGERLLPGGFLTSTFTERGKRALFAPPSACFRASVPFVSPSRHFG